MKIGVLIDRLNMGGVEKVAIEEVRSFRRLGIDAKLLILTRKPVVKNALSDLIENIPTIYLEDRLPRPLRISFKIPLFYFFSFFHVSYPFLIPFVVKKNEYDIILSHNTYTSFTAITISLFKKIPYAVFIWDPISYIINKAYPKGPIRFLFPVINYVAKQLDKQIISRAQVVFLSSTFHKNYLSKYISGNKEIIVIPQGVRTPEKINSRRGDYILTLTAWKFGKGLETMMKIIKDMKNVKLHVVGVWIHKEYFKKIKKLVKDFNISHKVNFITSPSQKDLTLEYSKARLSVIINNERGFGLPALEGAANGCTFVIPQDCGVCSFFKNEVDGFYFKYGDTVAMKKYLNKLVNNERLAYKMGKHAWKTVREKYSDKIHAQCILENIKKSQYE